METDALLGTALLATDGSRTTLRDQLGARRTIAVFVRHFG